MATPSEASNVFGTVVRVGIVCDLLSYYARMRKVRRAVIPDSTLAQWLEKDVVNKVPQCMAKFAREPSPG